MYLAWRRFLPLSLNYLLFFVGVSLILFYTSMPLRDALKSHCHRIRKPRISVDPKKYLDKTGDTYIQTSFIGKDRGRSTDRSTGRPTT